jgi:hypothetical protein
MLKCITFWGRQVPLAPPTIEVRACSCLDYHTFPYTSTPLSNHLPFLPLFNAKSCLPVLCGGDKDIYGGKQSEGTHSRKQRVKKSVPNIKLFVEVCCGVRRKREKGYYFDSSILTPPPLGRLSEREFPKQKQIPEDVPAWENKFCERIFLI